MIVDFGFILSPVKTDVRIDMDGDKLKAICEDQC